jgi:hypothetical protein
LRFKIISPILSSSNQFIGTHLRDLNMGESQDDSKSSKKKLTPQQVKRVVEILKPVIENRLKVKGILPSNQRAHRTRKSTHDYAGHL